jgi:PAS domain S-box-containing protein
MDFLMRSPEELERELVARQEAERRLQAANDELLRRVEERTAELAAANAALRDERALLETTLASIGEGVIVTDPEGRVTFLNAAAEALIGWGAAEASGLPLAEVFRIVDEATRRPVENPALRALREGVTIGHANHSVLLTRSGVERTIDDSAAPIRQAGGAVRGAVLVFRDVTEHEQAERDLRASERRFRSATEAFVGMVYERDVATGHVERSSGLFGLLGFRPDEAEPTAAWWLARIHPDDAATVDQQIHTAISTGAPIREHEYRITHRDGSERHVWDRAVLVRDDAGQVVRMVGCTIDITERKRAERALRETDRLKDEFIATLAHELRNPLAPIRNALQILKLQSPADPDLAWNCDVIGRQVDQMVRLLEDLLDVSRITRSKLNLRKSPVTLSAVVATAVETSRPIIEACGHELIVSLPSEPVPMEADPVRLAQVFANLLNNAAKYTDRGGQIRLSAARTGHEVVVSVKDTGIGIAPEVMPRIFETFSQATPALERSQGGLGIGLSLVKGVVELHDGRIEARSDGPGKGSEFIVRLPIVAPQVEAPVNPAAATSPLPRCKIVVADDNHDAAETLGRLLRLMGNQVRTAHDGQEAVDVVETFQPDIALLDIGMPALNGYEAACRIRQQPGGNAIFLVALTGWGQEEDRRRSYQAGFNAHLVKPVDASALAELLRAQPLWRQTAASQAESPP